MQFELGSVFRFLSWLFFTLIIDGIIKTTGRVVRAVFTKNKGLSDNWLIAIGSLFWVLVLVFIAQANQFIAVDVCLDAGGSYDYDAQVCIK
ncbi:hypothetical protein [Vibrio sp. 16]|uniref:hypothetical protein n=1 Tax=Vibrio sp. 16 TaxID=391586 RepID=UPI0002E487D8|nr:hypothetical protein [Vibrio sp. 16]CAK4074036.1 hypothetical protein VDT1_3171 [Vibrio sp. 16]